MAIRIIKKSAKIHFVIVCFSKFKITLNYIFSRKANVPAWYLQNNNNKRQLYNNSLAVLVSYLCECRIGPGHLFKLDHFLGKGRLDQQQLLFTVLSEYNHLKKIKKNVFYTRQKLKIRVFQVNFLN